MVVAPIRHHSVPIRPCFTELVCDLLFHVDLDMHHLLNNLCGVKVWSLIMLPPHNQRTRRRPPILRVPAFLYIFNEHIDPLSHRSLIWSTSHAIHFILVTDVKSNTPRRRGQKALCQQAIIVGNPGVQRTDHYSALCAAIGHTLDYHPLARGAYSLSHSRRRACMGRPSLSHISTHA